MARQLWSEPAPASTALDTGMVHPVASATLTVIHSVFRNNRATGVGTVLGAGATTIPLFGGGAIYSYGGDTVIADSAFEDNSGASGGALANWDSNLTVVNSVFTNNAAHDQSGGAIAIDGKALTLCGVLVRNNQARLQGGGVSRYVGSNEPTVIDTSTFDGNATTNPGRQRAPLVQQPLAAMGAGWK